MKCILHLSVKPLEAVYCWCSHRQHAQATGSPLEHDQFNASFTKVSLNDVVVVEFGPLKDVLLTHNV